MTDPSRLDEMCQRLLANPLIEDYEVLLDGDTEFSDKKKCICSPAAVMTRMR